LSVSVGTSYSSLVPFEGSGAMHTIHIKLIEKLVVDFLFVIIELLLLAAFVLSQSTHLTDRQTKVTTIACCNRVRCMLIITVCVIYNITRLASFLF